MKRAILVMALMLAFTGAAHAERLVCTVDAYEACQLGVRCAPQAPNTEGTSFLIDIGKESFVYCSSSRTGDCSPYPAHVSSDDQYLRATASNGTNQVFALVVDQRDMRFKAATVGMIITNSYGSCVKLH